MLRELKCTLRFSDHVRDVTLKHFELRLPALARELASDDVELHRAYYTDIISDKPAYSDLTQHQKYLHDLHGLLGPVISAYRLRKRIPRLSPRTRSISASAHLEDAGQRLALEAYHFKERLKLVSRSMAVLIVRREDRDIHHKFLGNLILSFEKSNDRLLRYRNFIVHGPLGRTDEFSDLRGWELGGIFYHQDLWFDYNNAFWETQEQWTILAKALLESMQSGLIKVQAENERLIAAGSFDFSLAEPTAIYVADGPTE